MDTFAYYLRALILHSLLACCVSSPFLNIVTRATTGERKPNGSLPKLRESLIKIWGEKNKINFSWIRRQETNSWSLVAILISFDIWNIGCCRVMFVDSIEWSTLMLEMVISTIICLDNGHWRICWILMMPIRVYPLLFQIPTLDTYPEFLIEQCSRVPIPDSNCYCSNIELRYLVYCYSCYYYTAPRQWVIMIVYCTKQ